MAALQNDLAEVERDLTLRKMLWESIDEWEVLVSKWKATQFDGLAVDDVQKDVTRFVQTVFLLEKGVFVYLIPMFNFHLLSFAPLKTFLPLRIPLFRLVLFLVTLLFVSVCYMPPRNEVQFSVQSIQVSKVFLDVLIIGLFKFESKMIKFASAITTNYYPFSVAHRGVSFQMDRNLNFTTDVEYVECYCNLCSDYATVC